MRLIIAETLNQTPVGQRRVELVERKGVGHPDSFGEAAMGEVARALCRGYQARVGRVLRRAVLGVWLRAILLGTTLSCLEADCAAAARSAPADAPSVHACELERGPFVHR